MCGKTNEEVTAEYAKMLQRSPDALTDEEKRQAFYDAISASSPRVLDNFGIDINVSELPNWPVYRFCTRRKYGWNWLSRMWCRRLRPFLAPGLQAEVDVAYSYAEKLHRAEFMDAVLERYRNQA